MRGNKSISLRKIKISEGLLSIIPVIIILLFIRFYPMFMAVYRSFTNWDGLFRSDFLAGLAAPFDAIGDMLAWPALGVAAITATWAGFSRRRDELPDENARAAW